MRLATPEWAKHQPVSSGPQLHPAGPGERAFGYHLTVARRGGITEAVQLFYGFGKDGREEHDRRAREGRDALLKCLAAQQCEATRQGIAELHFVLAAELRHTAGGWRAQGSEVFFGVQHELQADGKRVYVRAGRSSDAQRRHAQGGLAKRLGVCVRTLFRWWRELRRFGVWTTHLPPRNAPDAVLTRAGTQVYRQRWLSHGTPRCVSRLLPLVRRQRPRREPLNHDGSLRVDDVRHLGAAIDGRPWVDDIPF